MWKTAVNCLPEKMMIEFRKMILVLIYAYAP